MAGAPADDAGHYLIALVGVDGLHELDYQRFRVAALAFLHVQHPLDAVDGVAGADVAEVLPVVAGEEAVDAGQAPASPPGPVPHIGSAGMADDGAVLGKGCVFLVAENGVGVPDAVDEVQQRPQRSVSDEIFSTHPRANHRLGAGDGFG